MLDGSGLDVDREDVLIEAFVETLEHGIMLGLGIVHREILLDALNALNGHVLRDLHSVGTPRCYHLAAGTYEGAVEGRGFDERGIAVEPA